MMKKGCIVAAAAVLAAGCISKEKSEATCHDDFRLRRYIADYEGLKRKKELEKRGIYIGGTEEYICSPNQGDCASKKDKSIEELKAEISQLKVFREMYFNEHAKVAGLEDSVAEWKGKYEDSKKLREQRDFYMAAAAKAHYLDYIDRKEAVDTILCYGDKVVGTDKSNDDDTRFYKKAHIVSKIEFVPLKLYRVTDGKEVRWLVFTPPDRSVTVGGIPYPVVEAHGGDWVELKLNEELEKNTGKDLMVYNWQDGDGNIHIGTKVPADALAHSLIAVWPAKELKR